MANADTQTECTMASPPVTPELKSTTQGTEEHVAPTSTLSLDPVVLKSPSIDLDEAKTDTECFRLILSRPRLNAGDEGAIIGTVGGDGKVSFSVVTALLQRTGKHAEERVRSLYTQLTKTDNEGNLILPAYEFTRLPDAPISERRREARVEAWAALRFLRSCSYNSGAREFVAAVDAEILATTRREVQYANERLRSAEERAETSAVQAKLAASAAADPSVTAATVELLEAAKELQCARNEVAETKRKAETELTDARVKAARQLSEAKSNASYTIGEAEKRLLEATARAEQGEAKAAAAERKLGFVLDAAVAKDRFDDLFAAPLPQGSNKDYAVCDLGHDPGVYVLELQREGHYYVGRSSNVAMRVREHQDISNGSGSAAFVRAKGGVRRVLLPVTPSNENHKLWEQQETLYRMMQHGFDKVRGFEWTGPTSLSPNDLHSIKQMIMGSGDLCRRCGNPGHFAAKCANQTKARWLMDLEALRNRRPTHYSPDAGKMFQSLASADSSAKQPAK